MPWSNTAWKDLERLVAAELNGVRVMRGADFSKSDVDVKVADFESLRIDAKYRQRWAHHKFLDEVRTKYCSDTDDIPILITKAAKQRGAVVCLSLSDFGILLNVIRELRNEQK